MKKINKNHKNFSIFKNADSYKYNVLERLTHRDERSQFQLQFNHNPNYPHHFLIKNKNTAFPVEKYILEMIVGILVNLVFFLTTGGFNKAS